MRGDVVSHMELTIYKNYRSKVNHKALYGKVKKKSIALRDYKSLHKMNVFYRTYGTITKKMYRCFRTLMQQYDVRASNALYFISE